MCTGAMPEELGKLTALEELSLGRNNLSGEKTQTGPLGFYNVCRNQAWVSGCVLEVG